MHVFASGLKRLNRIHETEARSPDVRLERGAKVENEKGGGGGGQDKVAARIICRMQSRKTYLRTRCATGNVQRCTDNPIRTWAFALVISILRLCRASFLFRALTFWRIDAEVVVASKVNRRPGIHNCAGSEQCGCDVKTTQQ